MPGSARKKLRLHHGIDGCVATYDEQRGHDQDKGLRKGGCGTHALIKGTVPNVRARRTLEAPRASLRWIIGPTPAQNMRHSESARCSCRPGSNPAV